MQLGRPKGEANILKLDAFRDEIRGYLKEGINKRAISKADRVFSVNTLSGVKASTYSHSLI
jgi:hypothetical protein